MDAFYASVEQRDFPKFKGKPLVVGGSPDSRGVVATCSYEARQFGIRSAMPCSHAYRLCPDAIFTRPRFAEYKAVSVKIHQIFRQYTDIIEPLSLDEAYLDVSNCEQHDGSATLIANAIRQDIEQQLALTASAGVSYNKFLAKIASDINKPNGITIIKPEEGPEFVAALPIGKFFGIGKVTEKKMQNLGIHHGADLLNWSQEQLLKQFGKFGGALYAICRGIDDRPVRTSRTRKSISKETTFASDIIDMEYITEMVERLAIQVAQVLQEKSLSARTATLKVKYLDFQQITRSQSITSGHITDAETIINLVMLLLEETEVGQRAIRLIGVGCSNLQSTDSNEIIQETFDFEK